MESRILAVSEELFQKYGIKSITMDEIAKEIGISKKTIYQFFANKEDLVQEVILVGMEVEKQKSIEIQKKDIDPISEILLHMDHMKEVMSGINVTLIYDLKKYYPQAYETYNGFKSYFLEAVMTNLKKGVEMQYYRQEINIEIIAKLRVETIDLAFDPTIFKYGKYSFWELQVESLDHFLRGITTQKGLKLYEKLKSKIIK